MKFLYTSALSFCCSVAFSTPLQAQSTSQTKPQELGEATVHGNSLKRVQRSALNVVAVDVTKVQNTNLDLAGVLNKVSGVRIRQEGGLGSSMQINLNGFTGKHVKVFLDGVPLEGATASFNLNNMPASLASSIEVYKGVVPTALGSDALGGAINIVTTHRPGQFVDASYSFGSFNTHRLFLHAGVTTQRGFVANLTGYYNTSDNDYKVQTQSTDLKTLVIDPVERTFRRFHDRYHNEAIIAELGFVNKPWADRLLLNVNYSHDYAQVQHANLMKIVFGGKFRTSQGLTTRLTYAKRGLFLPRLDLNASAKYDVAITENTDTMARMYNWAGEFIEKDTQGEGIATIAKYRARTAVATAGLRYRLADAHTLSLNDTYSYYTRRTTNDVANVAQQSASTFMRRTNGKNVMGIDYRFVPSARWNAMAMVKHYSTHVQGPVNVAAANQRPLWEEQSRSASGWGYGVAGTYHLSSTLQLKLSFERTLRLPNVRELFGDGDYEIGATTLRPETSYNFNFNAIYDCHFGRHTASIELGVNNRNIRDYIIRTISSRGTAVSTNHGKVLGLGADLTLRYGYGRHFALNASYALQSMRNHEKFTAYGATSYTYKDRIPNLPYSFGSADATYTFDNVFGKGNTLALTYGLQYTHRFFRSWVSEGAKFYIPSQLSHDASLVYSLQDGRYNIALEANNFTDEALFDNYSLQKPGRSFSIKFRYLFQKHPDATKRGRNGRYKRHNGNTDYRRRVYGHD